MTAVKKRKDIFLCGLAMFLLAAAAMLIKSGTAFAADNQAKPVKLETKDKKLAVEVTVGYGGYNKYSRNRYVTAKVKNSGEDFSGSLRFMTIIDYSYEMGGMTEQKFDIASGAEKTINLSLLDTNMADNANYQDYEIQLCDDEDDILAKKSMQVIYSPGVMVGVLSDDTTDVGYIQSVFQKNLNASQKLTEEDLTDDDMDDMDDDYDEYVTTSQIKQSYNDSSQWAGQVVDLKQAEVAYDVEALDVFDLIIIHNFDTTTLQKEQVEAILQWTRRGGVLVLAAGGNPDKVLKGFAEAVPVKKTGEAQKIKTTFGWKREDIIQFSGNQGNTDAVETVVSGLELQEKKKTLIEENGRELLQQRELGKGTVLLAEFSMNLPKNKWNTYGTSILSVLISSLGNRYYDNEAASTGYYNYSYYEAEGLSSNETDILPNLSLYAFLLLSYAVLVGPVWYLLFKKKGKSTWLWGVVPATAVVFSVIIYLIGSSTRIKKPYVKYVSEIALDGEDAGTAQEDTHYTVASAKNRSYEITLEKTLLTQPVFTQQGGSFLGNEEYRYGVRQQGDSTVLDFLQVSAFTDSHFLSRRSVPVEGGIESKIQKKNSKAAGTVTNRFSYTLEDCFIRVDGKIYYCKELPAGKSISLEKLGNPYNVGDQVDMGWDVVETFGISRFVDEGDSRDAKKFALIRKKIAKDTGNWFYGFMPENEDAELFPSFFGEELDVYGVTAVSKELQMDSETKTKKTKRDGGV